MLVLSGGAPKIQHRGVCAPEQAPQSRVVCVPVMAPPAGVDDDAQLARIHDAHGRHQVGLALDDGLAEQVKKKG